MGDEGYEGRGRGTGEGGGEWVSKLVHQLHTCIISWCLYATCIINMLLNNESTFFAPSSSLCFDLFQQRVFDSSGVNQAADVVCVGVVTGPHCGVRERH